MSALYKKARKIGYSKPKAFKAVGLAKKISKHPAKGAQRWLKKKHPYLDFDMDGKVNKYDCQPRNRWKQDKTPEEEAQEAREMDEKIEAYITRNSPYYATDEERKEWAKEEKKMRHEQIYELAKAARVGRSAGKTHDDAEAYARLFEEQYNPYGELYGASKKAIAAAEKAKNRELERQKKMLRRDGYNV